MHQPTTSKTEDIHLDVLLELQQGGVHDVPEAEVVAVHLQRPADDLRDALPMTRLHGLVGHEFEERTHVVEVVDGLLEGVEGRPFLQALRELSASVERGKFLMSASWKYSLIFIFSLNVFLFSNSSVDISCG